MITVILIASLWFILGLIVGHYIGRHFARNELQNKEYEVVMRRYYGKDWK